MVQTPFCSQCPGPACNTMCKSKQKNPNAQTFAHLFLSKTNSLRLETTLPDSLDPVAEIIDDVATAETMASRQKTTDDALDVAP